MIKVVHISTSLSGGAGIAAYRLHEGLLNSGVCDSFFVCQRAESDSKNKKNVIEVAPSPLSFFERFKWKFGLYTDRIAAVYKKISDLQGEYEVATWPETNYRVELETVVLDADIVHLHWVSGFINYPTFFKKLKHKKIVWTLHDMNPFMGIFHYKGDGDRNPRFKELDVKAQKIKSNSLRGRSLNIVPLSNWIEEEAKKNPVFRDFVYQSIPNGIDCRIFQSVDKEKARQELNIPENSNVILFVSENIDNYRKGMTILSLSLSRIKKDTQFLVLSVGKGKLSLPEYIQYLSIGMVYDEVKLATVYSAADLFVIPSYEDNLPNVMLESFACGTPVLSFSVGGMREWISEVNGVLCNQLTANAFANSIELFFSQKSFFNRNSIREFALQHFDASVQIRNMEAFYKKTLQ